jgi:hypothetical protein
LAIAFVAHPTILTADGRREAEADTAEKDEAGRTGLSKNLHRLDNQNPGVFTWLLFFAGYPIRER